MRIDQGIRVLLFDCYQTLVGIWTDEQDPATWERLAAFLRGNGLPADPAGLHWRYEEIVRDRLSRSREPHPEVDIEDVFRQVVAELGGDPGGARGGAVGAVDDDGGPARLATLATREFRAASTRWLEVFPDTHPALRELGRRYRLGLVTDAQRAFLVPELRATGLDGIFEFVVVSSDLGFRKPDRRMFELALDAFGVGAGEALYVGDSLGRDVRGARAAGLTGVWLDRRAQAADATAGVPVINSLTELGATGG